MASLKDYRLVPDKGGDVWRIANNSSWAIAMRGETEYRIKVYAWYPPKSAGETYERSVAECRGLYERLEKLNGALKKADGGANCFAYATDVLDEREGENAGVMELVPTVRGAADLMAYEGDFPRRLELMKSLSEAMVRLHAAGIRHGDLKPQNVLFVRHADRERAVLIDFDHAYRNGETLPGGYDIGGTEGYHSPEVKAYIDLYDEEELTFLAIERDAGKKPLNDAQKKALARSRELSGKISLRSDIYALGVLFHNFLTGGFPGWNERGAVVNREGLNNKAWLCDLIAAMLREDPFKRPSAADVARVMREESLDDGRPPFDEPWPEHAGWSFCRNNMLRVVRIRRAEEDGRKVYEITREGELPRIWTFEMLRNQNMVRPAAKPDAAPREGFDSAVLWPDDAAGYRLDEAALTRQGYVRVERRSEPQQYDFVRADGTVVAKSSFIAKRQGFLIPK